MKISAVHELGANREVVVASGVIASPGDRTTATKDDQIYYRDPEMRRYSHEVIPDRGNDGSEDGEEAKSVAKERHGGRRR